MCLSQTSFPISNPIRILSTMNGFPFFKILFHLQIRNELEVLMTREASLLANYSPVLSVFQNSPLILNVSSGDCREVKSFGRKVEFLYEKKYHHCNPIMTQFLSGDQSIQMTQFLVLPSTTSLHSLHVIRLLSVLHSLSLPDTPLEIPATLQGVSSSIVLLHFTPGTVLLTDLLEEGQQIAAQWAPELKIETLSGIPKIPTFSYRAGVSFGAVETVRNGRPLAAVHQNLHVQSGDSRI